MSISHRMLLVTWSSLARPSGALPPYTASPPGASVYANTLLSAAPFPLETMHAHLVRRQHARILLARNLPVRPPWRRLRTVPYCLHSVSLNWLAQASWWEHSSWGLSVRRDAAACLHAYHAQLRAATQSSPLPLPVLTCDHNSYDRLTLWE